MLNKKAFTLIELLAVIVVLAIIAVIAVPIILGVIDKAKLGVLKDSAYGLVEVSELYLAKNMEKEIETKEFTCSNGTCLSGTEKISYKGNIDSGRIRIYSDSKIELCITDNKNAALKTVASEEVTVSAGTCNYDELNYGVVALVSKEALDEMTKKYNDLKALVDQTDVTALDVKEGKKAYSNGEIVTGTYKGMQKILLGTGTSFDLKTNYATYGLNETDYTKITESNFLVEVTNSSGAWNIFPSYATTGIYEGTSVSRGSVSYNNSTGILTANRSVLYYGLTLITGDGQGHTHDGSVNMFHNVYLLY